MTSTNLTTSRRKKPKRKGRVIFFWQRWMHAPQTRTGRETERGYLFLQLARFQRKFFFSKFLSSSYPLNPKHSLKSSIYIYMPKQKINIHQEASPWLPFGPWSKNRPASARLSWSQLWANGTRPLWAAPRPASCHRRHPSTRNAYFTHRERMGYTAVYYKIHF